ncbi:MAG: A/G-specific adenine glycosylase [Bdellovibrionota bacterium]|jgi:A/G-specific adenine glycosylase
MRSVSHYNTVILPRLFSRGVFFSQLCRMPTSDDESFFRDALLQWYRPDRRPMPWKAITDPYRIWLSEIILQQTRVEQGLPYFEQFVEAYPTVMELAAAEDEAVMKLWEGLGYYSRARNLLKAARMVANDHDGKFPDTYAGLRGLPGVGPYTAAAIASFAFGRQVAVLDGNVFRILARFYNDATPIDTGKGRKHYQELVDRGLGDAEARLFNQAIMDFGALACTPKKASCNVCPLAERCGALADGTVYDLPVKEKKVKRRTRYFHFLILADGEGSTVIEQRLEKDIWQSLYQFPLVETTEPGLKTDALALHPNWPDGLPARDLRFVKRSTPMKHLLTHQTIITVFHHFSWVNLPSEISGKIILENKMFKNYAFPRVITRYLAEKSLLLDLF